MTAYFGRTLHSIKLVCTTSNTTIDIRLSAVLSFNRPKRAVRVKNSFSLANFALLVAATLLQERHRNDQGIYPEAETLKKLYALRVLAAKGQRAMWTKLESGR